MHPKRPGTLMLLIAIVLSVTATMYAHGTSGQTALASPAASGPEPGKQQASQAKGCSASRPLAATAGDSRQHAMPAGRRRDGRVSTYRDTPADDFSASGTGTSENDESSLIDANTGGSPQSSPAQ